LWEGVKVGEKGKEYGEGKKEEKERRGKKVPQRGR